MEGMVILKSNYWIVAALALAPTAWGQQAQKNWKDRAEYDLFQSCAQQQDPNKKLDCVKSWRDKYPSSDFKEEGLKLSLSAYVALSKSAEVAATSKEILTISPTDLTSLYYLTSMALNNTDPAALDSGEKAANTLLGSLDATFAADKKPATTKDEEWNKAKRDMQVLGTRVLGWVAMTKKDNAKAEQQFQKLLDMNFKDGEVSYWMYSVIRATKEVKRYSEALFYLARAASLPKDQGGFADQQRRQIDDFFVKAYNTYHGADDAGLAELRKMSMGAPKPPADFRIKTSIEIATEKENEFKSKNPQLAFWMGIKKELAGAEGEKFFEGTVKGAELPGKIEGTEYTKLKGRLISHKPATNPKELVLQMDTTQANATDGDVTIKIADGKFMNGKADPGVELEFNGTASAFTKDPFMVTFDVDKENLGGWPAQAAPPAKKAAPVRKAGPKGAPKKK